MKNKELFLKDPLKLKLLNEGVSSNNTTDLDTLRYELETFVCDGEYRTGLVKILQGFTSNFSQPEQKAAWVSGFYGSGKSHLVKVLRHLWTDTRLGADSARTLATLPEDVAELLTDLTTLGKRHNGLHAAGGTLKAGVGSVRLRLLGIVFASLGLPEEYPFAKFQLQLQSDEKLDAFKKAIEAAGKAFETELGRLYTSAAVASAYLKCYPHLGDVSKVGPALRAQFPDAKDISIDTMLKDLRLSLTRKGGLPCTVIVLDEIQQFIGGSAELANDVQEVTEACSKQLGSRVMFVGTGQSALSDTPSLQRLMGRYSIKIHLRDNDVEKVVRTVVLQKKETRKQDIATMVETNSGEISRQLNGTKFATVLEDKEAYVPDYPLLPVRRRFWERVLHSVDPTGTTAQMRTQLRVVHEACRDYADRELGTVVPADYLYPQLANDLVISGEMQKRFQEIIEEQKKKSPNGALRSRVCSLVFLVNKLPREDADTGVRANAEHLADLMSEDLKRDSTELRQKIPAVLQALAADGVLMEIEGEFRLQTTEGAAWESEFRKTRAALLSNEPQIAALRGQQLMKAIQGSIGSVAVLHGDCKERRRLLIHNSGEPPPKSDGLVAWVRDGFAESEPAVLSDIRKRSVDDPLLHVFVPRAKADELKDALATAQAAEDTERAKGSPAGDEGKEARRSMLSRKANAELRAADTIAQIVSGARVFLSGGQEQPGTELRGTVEAAAQQVLSRLYPKFDLADSPNWPTVLKKAKEGSPNALEAVGHKGDPHTHPVATLLLQEIGAGKKGSELRKHFTGASFGWPQDAIDAVLAALMASNHISARFQGQVLAARDCDQKKLGTADFHIEKPVLTAAQKIKVRKLYQAFNHKFSPGEEGLVAPQFLEVARRLASEAGGFPPAPQLPDASVLLELETKTGNELLHGLFDKADALTTELTQWAERATKIKARLPFFELAESLNKFAAGLPEHERWTEALNAIRENRTLLDQPDPVSPLLQALGVALRKALTKAQEQFQDAYETQIRRIAANSIWHKIDESKKRDLLAAAGAVQREVPRLSTEDELRRALQACDLRDWRTHIDALAAQFDKALAAAVVELEPKAHRVSLPSATIRNPEELESWLAEAEREITSGLKSGPVIV